MKNNFKVVSNASSDPTHYWKQSSTGFLVNCGLVQGELNEDALNDRPFEIDPQQLQLVLLIHDHYGLLPRLNKEGFRGKIFCIKATTLLTREVLPNTCKYTDLCKDSDVKNLDYFDFDGRPGFTYGHHPTVVTDLAVAFYRSLHILGSASIGIF